MYLGNIYAQRDWGHAKDYVEMQWKILQQKHPKDYIIATGKTFTVKQFVNEVCKILKLKTIWKGKGIQEKCFLIKNKKKEVIIKVDKRYFRPIDINFLKGNARKAHKELNFKPKFDFKSLVRDMVEKDLILAKKNVLY